MFKMTYRKQYHGFQSEFFESEWAMKKRYLDIYDGCCWDFHFYDINGEEIKI